jgi:hypothetical protein
VDGVAGNAADCRKKLTGRRRRMQFPGNLNRASLNRAAPEFIWSERAVRHVARMADVAEAMVQEETPEVSERRAFRRVAVEIPGKVFLPSTREETDCIVTNISPAGALITCATERLAKIPVILYVAGLGRFEGHGTWERDQRHGILFHNSELKQARLADQLVKLDGQAQPPETMLRRHKRIATHTLAKFTRESGATISCTVLDFSTSGLSLKSDVRPQIGERIQIGGMIGRVARYHESGIAIEFIGRERDDTVFRQELDSLALWRVVEAA